MTNEKQIEELFEDLLNIHKSHCYDTDCKDCEFDVKDHECVERLYAKYLHNLGYRKHSDDINTVKTTFVLAKDKYPIEIGDNEIYKRFLQKEGIIV